MLVEISLTLCNSVICYRFICVKYIYTRDPFKESQNLLFGSKYFSFGGSTFELHRKQKLYHLK